MLFTFFRYGFHGPSHQYVVEQTAKRMGRPLSDLAIVSCHLGAGCSIAATLGGVSQDTSMGFSPLEGLMMGQRCGAFSTTYYPYSQFHLVPFFGYSLSPINLFGESLFLYTQPH